MFKKCSILIGTAGIIIGILVVIFNFNTQKKQTAETTAKIIRIDSQVETDSDGFHTTYYTPVIEYTVNEQRYIKKLTNSKTSNSLEYKVGDEIKIQYNPDKPQELSKNGDISGIIGGIIFIVVGAVVFCTPFFKKSL